MLCPLLNNPTWLPKSSDKAISVGRYCYSIHLEPQDKVENADELSEILQSLRKIDSCDMGYFEKGHEFIILCFHWRYGDHVYSGLCVDLSSTPRTEGKITIKCVSQA